MNSIFKLATLASLGAIGPFVSQQSRAADAAPSDDALTTIVVTAEREKRSSKMCP